MSRYFFSHDLTDINNFIIESQIKPKIQSRNYLHQEFFVLYPNNLLCENLKTLLLKQYKAISPGFIMTLSEFKNEIFSNIIWEQNKSNSNYKKDLIPLTPSAQSLMILETLKTIKEKNSKFSYYSSHSKYRAFRTDLLEWIAIFKKDIVPLLNGKEKTFNLSYEQMTSDLEQLFSQLKREDQNPDIKYKELIEIIQTYELLKSEASLKDQQDIEYLCYNYLNTIKKEESFLHNTKEIFFLNINDLSNLDFKIIKALSDLDIELTLTFYFDLNRSDQFSTGKKIKNQLDLFSFQQEKINKSHRKAIQKDSFLNNLSQNLFNTNYTIDESDSLPFLPESCHLIQENSLRDEIQQVLKRVKSLLNGDPDLKAHEIALVIRNPESYLEDIEELSHQFQIPLYSSFKKSIHNEKLIQTLFLIMELKIYNFPSHLLINFIKSNYVYLRGEKLEQSHLNTRYTADLIDQFYQQIKNGKREILPFLKSIQEKKGISDQEIKKINMAIHYLEKIKEYINRFPSPDQEADVYEMSQILKEHITDNFSILYNTYKYTDLAITQRDSVILKKFLDTLDELNYYRNLRNQKKMTFFDFYSAIKEMLYTAFRTLKTEKKNRIHCLSPKDIQGLSYKYVFVLGLIEGEFPKKAKLNRLFKDRERTVLNKKFSVLQNRDELYLKEEQYILNCISSAIKKIYLSYSLVDSSGKEALPSFFLDELSLFLNVDINKLVITNDSKDFYSKNAFYEYYGKYHYSFDKKELELIDKVVLENQLDENKLESIKEKAEVERKRSSLDFTEYDGELLINEQEHKGLMIEKIKAHFQILSPSHIERYAHCPHRFFFYDVLNLKKKKKETDTLDSANKGTAVHKVLHRLYSKRIDTKEYFPEKDSEWIKNEIEQKTQELFESEIKDGYQSPLIWGNEFNRLVDDVHHFVEKDITENQDYFPMELELDFGKNGEDLLMIYDRDKKLLAQISGAIDRIDISNDKSKVRLIDYKSGKGPSSKDLKKEIIHGMKFQPFLYSSKVKERYKLHLESWNYYYVLKNQRKINKASLDLNEPIKENGKISYNDISQYYIGIYLNQIHTGRFPGNPKECHDFCEFKNVCRVDISLAQLKEKKHHFWESTNEVIKKLDNS